MTKRTMRHAASDVGLIFIAYNLRRMLNILSETSKKAGNTLLLPPNWPQDTLVRLLSDLLPSLGRFGPVPKLYDPQCPTVFFRHF